MILSSPSPAPDDEGFAAALIGLCGFSTMSILASHRLYVQVRSWYRLKWSGRLESYLIGYGNAGYAVQVRLIFHLLMAISFLLELPQYFAWIFHRNGGPKKDYWIALYPCHMIAYVTFFSAFTIVINEWRNVAEPIDLGRVDREQQVRSRRVYQCSMIAINVFVGTTAIILLCRIFAGVENLNDDPLYKIFIVTVMVAQIVLAMLTVKFGLGLRSRIHSAAGTASRNARQVQGMVCKLVVMMSLCFACFLVRFISISLNTFYKEWGTGKSSQIFMLFLSLDSWIPVWVPGSALLYLMRQTLEQRSRADSKPTPIKVVDEENDENIGGNRRMNSDPYGTNGIDEDENVARTDYGALLLNEANSRRSDEFGSSV
jgi:hypothetical protein